MSNYDECQELWGEFLNRWPMRKLESMTLEEYVSTNNDDTFAYWVETRTKPLGSILGNTAIKFGIYKRKKNAKEQPGIIKDDFYSWYSKFGGTQQEAFSTIKSHILYIAKNASVEDLEAIDKIVFSPMVKWKIAFLYQNRKQPIIINVFSKEVLDALIESDKALAYPKIYRYLSSKRGDIPLFEYGEQCWVKASEKLEAKRNEEVINQFLHIRGFAKNYKNWSPETLTAFCVLLRTCNKAKLDIYTTEMTRGSSIRVGRKELESDKAKDVFITFEPRPNKITVKERFNRVSDDYIGLELTPEFVEHLYKSGELKEYSQKHTIGRKAYWPKDYLAKTGHNKVTIAEPQASKDNLIMNSIPLNQILYGPPGTGKTYNTINKALEILDPDFINDEEERIQLKERFDELLGEGRIAFVTFHQSFSYEDFIEGIKAEFEGDGIQYKVESGIFKILCDKANSSQSSSSLNEAIESLIETASLSEVVMKTSRGQEFGVTHRGGSTFRIRPFSSDKDVDYRANIDHIRSIYRGADTSKIYNASYVKGILEYLTQEYHLSEEQNNDTEAQPYVLIIDEINRGNIASIFGELISLIEDSKRKGCSEELEVKLPYSKELFSVPKKLYIIGTMNTADKSLAQVDVALRRRFAFKEMMPSTRPLKDIGSIEGVDVCKLLKAINKRIELLYDREHTIGHSFFIPLIKEPTLRKMREIFERQILPLLEEYFFEDWDKIRLVLGDHLKSKTDDCFIIPIFDESEITKLMGDDWENDGIVAYKRNLDALNNPDAYIGIYSPIKE